MVRITAMSRRFPPAYKRLWYVARIEGGGWKDGSYMCRIAGKTEKLYFESYDHILEFVTEMGQHYMRVYRLCEESKIYLKKDS